HSGNSRPAAGRRRNAETDRMDGNGKAGMNSLHRQAPHIRVGHTDTYAKQAQELVASVHDDAWGDVRPSVYETARVLSWTPWLEGHERRLAWLLEQQSASGGWGEGPTPYRLLPTLSVTEALLSALR